MPEIPVAGFVLEASGAALLATLLTSFGRDRPRAGLADWALGLWLLAAALLASIALSRVTAPALRQPVRAVATVLAYWSPALVLLGTWCRWRGEDRPDLRVRILVGLGVVAVVTVLVAPLTGDWQPLVRSGTRTLATLVAYLVGSGLLLWVKRGDSSFGARVLAFAFLGSAGEEALFLGLLAGGARPGGGTFDADLLVEAELVLLMLTGVGMIAWMLEDEHAAGLRLQEALHRREALSEMGALVGGAAHEARNPLFAISASLDALGARLGENEGASRLVAVMREPVARLSTLMTELLDYGRPIDVDLKRRPLAVVAAKAIESCAGIARPSGVVVELRGESSDGVVPMDEPRMLQVFQNLVQNAVEHSPRGGVVSVTLSDEPRPGWRGVRCAVRDAGAGFAPDDLPRVFEPFYSRRAGGTGLGLSIVRRIVVQHGGEVAAGNHRDGGAVVSVWLPSTPAAEGDRLQR
jgi:signal transduction histidine kinase